MKRLVTLIVILLTTGTILVASIFTAHAPLEREASLASAYAFTNALFFEFNQICPRGWEGVQSKGLQVGDKANAQNIRLWYPSAIAPGNLYTIAERARKRWGQSGAFQTATIGGIENHFYMYYGNHTGQVVVDVTAYARPGADQTEVLLSTTVLKP